MEMSWKCPGISFGLLSSNPVREGIEGLIREGIEGLIREGMEWRKGLTREGRTCGEVKSLNPP